MSIAVPTNASAQTAEAEVLFREGQRLMKLEQYDEACEKFEASDRIEPASGTELNLAKCRELNGQTASAWAMYLKAAASAKKTNNDKRAAEAKTRANALADQLVYLTIEVPPEVRVEGLVIKRNKVPLDPGLWDTKVPVDPDEYRITAQAPGYKRWSETVTVKTKNKVIEVPTLEKREGPDEQEEPIEERPRKLPRVPNALEHKYQTEATTLALVGVGGLVVGTAFALYGRNLEQQSDQLCPSIKCADANGVALNRTARTDALVANVSWAIGGAALITAGVLWYVGKPASPDSVAIVPVVDDTTAGFAVGGHF